MYAVCGDSESLGSCCDGYFTLIRWCYFSAVMCRYLCVSVEVDLWVEVKGEGLSG